MLAAAKTQHLKPHPKNESIYGKEPDLPADFLSSIERLGILQPLVVKADGTVISGHRRLAAAKSLGIEEVPVLIGNYESDLDEIEALVILNQQRIKSPSQIAREGMELQRIESERAKQRQGTRSDLGNVRLDSNESNTLENVAASLGISRDRWYKLKTIFEKAEAGDESAAEMMKALDAGDVSVHKAYKTIREERNCLIEEKAKAEGEFRKEQRSWDFEKKKLLEKQEEEIERRLEVLKKSLEPEVREKEVFKPDPETQKALEEAQAKLDKYETELKKIQQEGRDWRRLEEKKSKLKNEITKLTMKASEQRTEMTLMTALENVEQSRYIQDRIHDMCSRGEMSIKQLDEAERVMNAMVNAGKDCLVVIQAEREGLVKNEGGLRIVE